MFTIMQLLRFKKPLYLVGHSVIWIVSEVRRDLVRAGKRR